jgi:hypothetical protein
MIVIFESQSLQCRWECFDGNSETRGQTERFPFFERVARSIRITSRILNSPVLLHQYQRRPIANKISENVPSSKERGRMPRAQARRLFRVKIRTLKTRRVRGPLGDRGFRFSCRPRVRHTARSATKIAALKRPAPATTYHHFEPNRAAMIPGTTAPGAERTIANRKNHGSQRWGSDAGASRRTIHEASSAIRPELPMILALSRSIIRITHCFMTSC